MNSFPASDIFKIVEVSKAFPLNLKFELKDVQPIFDFSKSYVYSILFDGKPIYVGYSFKDKQKDIRISRWTKQLETILFRGYRVGLNTKSFKKYEITLKHNINQRYHPEIKVKKTDVMTSVNRIIFAAKNWNDIETLNMKNAALLNRVIFRIEETNKNLNTREYFQDRVKELINQQKPCCNG
jgi:hypothetical protein